MGVCFLAFREMDMKLATARKSSRLAGHKSLAKLEKLNSLIYYDTFNWMKQKPGPRSKAKGHVSAIYQKCTTFHYRRHLHLGLHC